MGTATALELASRGRHTLLLERFRFGHARGSSGGPTRIFRFTYEHPDYVRMAGPALDAWRELEDASDERLLYTTGGIDIGEGGRRSADALEAAGRRSHGHPEATMERWPARDRAGTPVPLQEQAAGVRPSGPFAQARRRRRRRDDAEETVVPRDRPERRRGAAHDQLGDTYMAPSRSTAVRLVVANGRHRFPAPSPEQVTYCRLAGEPHAFPPSSTGRAHDAGSRATAMDRRTPRMPRPTLRSGLDEDGPRPICPDADPMPGRSSRTQTPARSGWRAGASSHRRRQHRDVRLYTNTPDGELSSIGWARSWWVAVQRTRVCSRR
jgi:hypothetical protein